MRGDSFIDEQVVKLAR